MALCLIAGASLNVYRAAYWKTSGIHSPRGFQDPPATADGRPVHWARSLAKVEIFNQRWRPVRVTLTLRARDGSSTDATRVRVSADDRVVETFDLRPSWSTHSFVLTEPASSDGRLWLLLETATPGQDLSRAGFGFRQVKTTPILAARPVIVNGLTGAVLGWLAWLLLSPRRWPGRLAPAPASAPPTGADAWATTSPLALVLIAGALFLLFSGWALLRPPYQTADEPQHHLRTTSILRTPWLADPSRFDLDARYLNPLAYRPPEPILKLPFRGDVKLSAEEIPLVKATPWVPPGFPRNPGPFERVNASYPTLFYLTVFAIAQPVTSVLHLTPYQSSFVYRFATAGLAALLWTAAYVALVRTDATRPIAGWLLLLNVLNPMVVFLSSGVNPDAVGMPLSALAMLAIWNVLVQGTGGWRALACLLAAALVKPSAGSLFVALVCGIAAVWLFHRWQSTGGSPLPWPTLARRTLAESPSAAVPSAAAPAPSSASPISAATRAAAALHYGPALLVIAQAGLLSAITFYLWSPLLFAAQEGVYDPLSDFLLVRLRGLGNTWVEFWGRLGWLDYYLENGWYQVLFALVLVNVACVIWRPRRVSAQAWSFVLFATTIFVVFVATTVGGEFLYLTQAGYTLQGRYFLPAALGLLVPVLWHRVPAARYALLAGVIAVHLALAQRTVTRYYQDGWSGVRAALPFASTSPVDAGGTDAAVVP